MPKKIIKIDFRTKFISPDTRVWVLFPGQGYKFYDWMIGKDVVFADMPGLDVSEGTREDDESLRTQIAMSLKIRSYHLSSDPHKSEPSRDPSTYRNYKWTGQRLNAKGIINGLYGRAQQGDLVLISSPGGAWGTFHIGEFQAPPSRAFAHEVPYYREDAIPARRVRWLAAEDNLVLPKEVVGQLSSQNAFTLLAKNHYDTIFSLAYENYHRNDNSSSLFDIKSNNFSTVADMYLKIIANYSALICKSYDEKNIEELLRSEIFDLLFDIEEDSYTPNQQISINSPGTNLLRCSKNTPILAALLFTLWQFSPSEIKSSELQFVNSATGGQLDECDIPVAEAAKISAQLMSLDKLEKMCRTARKAKELSQVETPIRATRLND